MKTFSQFLENADLKQRQQNFTQNQDTGNSGGGILDRDKLSNSAKAEIERLEKKSEEERIKNIVKRELASEVYDPEIQGRSQIKQTGEGGRKQPKRDTESRRKPGQSPRMKAVGGGKMEPVGSYKDRKDIGSTKARSEREQQPEKERGSAEVKQSYADKVKAERRAAAQARIAARKSGQQVKSTATSSKDAEKKASELLKTKKAEPKKTEPAKPRRSWKTAEGGGMTRKERDSARNKERGQSQAEIKKRLRAEFEKNNGRKPNKKEAIQITAKAIAAAKASS
jgi:hypothetical protein